MINISEKDNGLDDWNYDSRLQDYLLNLLSTSTFEDRIRKNFENDINDMNMDKETYDRISFSLFTNQLDKVTHGFSYNMGDIKKHLRKLR